MRNERLSESVNVVLNKASTPQLIAEHVILADKYNIEWNKGAIWKWLTLLFAFGFVTIFLIPHYLYNFFQTSSIFFFFFAGCKSREWTVLDSLAWFTVRMLPSYTLGIDWLCVSDHQPWAFLPKAERIV